MATNDPATNKIETAHTGQEDDNRDTQAPDAATHLREILIRLEGGMVFPDCDSMVVDSDEEGEQTAILAERITPLETCYRDITDLGTLLLNSLCKDLLEADLQELLVAAMTCDNKLKAIKQEEKAEHRDRYQATSAHHVLQPQQLHHQDQPAPRQVEEKGQGGKCCSSPTSSRTATNRSSTTKTNTGPTAARWHHNNGRHYNNNNRGGHTS